MIVRKISTFSQKSQTTYLRDKRRLFEETEPLRGSVSILQVANSGYIIQKRNNQGLTMNGEGNIIIHV